MVSPNNGQSLALSLWVIFIVKSVDGLIKVSAALASELCGWEWKHQPKFNLYMKMDTWQDCVKYILSVCAPGFDVRRTKENPKYIQKAMVPPRDSITAADDDDAVGSGRGGIIDGAAGGGGDDVTLGNGESNRTHHSSEERDRGSSEHRSDEESNVTPHANDDNEIVPIEGDGSASSTHQTAPSMGIQAAGSLDGTSPPAMSEVTVTILGLVALAVMIAQLIAGVVVVRILITENQVVSKSVSEMELIKFGRGQRDLKQNGTQPECTPNGILVDDNTGIWEERIHREDVQLDAYGTYDFSSLEQGFSYGDLLALVGVLTSDLVFTVNEISPTNEVQLFLRTKRGNFGFGLRMHTSVTGIDGETVYYHMYDGDFENNEGIKERLENLASDLGVPLTEPVEYKNGLYTAEVNATFADLSTIINDVTRIYCGVFKVGKINNTQNDKMTINWAESETMTFPTWFWVVFVIVSIIYFAASMVDLTEIDDTEKLIMLSKDVKEEHNCLAPPIADLQKEVRWGYSHKPHAAEDTLHYGHLEQGRAPFPNHGVYKVDGQGKQRSSQKRGPQ